MNKVWIAGALLGAACGVRPVISPVGEYAEIKNLKAAPFAVGRVVLVELENKRNDAPLASLSLTVTPLDGGAAQVFGLSGGVFGIVLEQEGEYELIATDAATGDEVESLTVTAKQEASFRLSTFAGLNTSFESGGTSCAVFEELEDFDISDFVLHSNQALDVSLLALSADGEPLLGLLPVTLSASSASLIANSIPVSEFNVANGLSLTLEGAAVNETITLNLQDATTQETLSLSLKATSDQEIIECPE